MRRALPPVSENVRAKTILPAWVNSELTSDKRLLSPFARSIVRVCRRSVHARTCRHVPSSISGTGVVALDQSLKCLGLEGELASELVTRVRPSMDRCCDLADRHEIISQHREDAIPVLLMFVIYITSWRATNDTNACTEKREKTKVPARGGDFVLVMVACYDS